MDPDPSPHHRARRLDELAAAALAPAEVAELDGWRCRADPTRPFRRANTALPPIGAGVGDPSFAVARVEAWYRRRGAVPRVQVSTADADWADLDDHLAARGWVVEAPVTVLVAPTGRIVAAAAEGRGGGAPDDPIDLDARAGVSEAWTSEVAGLHGDDDRARDRTIAYGRLLESFGGRGLAAAASVDGTPVAVGFAVVDGAWCGVFGMVTAPAARRRGTGRRVLGALAARAGAAGATGMYLQLEDDNTPAAALYGGVGFGPSHRYHYRSLLDP